MTTAPTPAFRKTAAQITSGLKLVPLVESYMRAAKFPEVFNVTFRDEGKARKPDGFFHPSTHPLWPERLLYYYLTQPEGMEEELFEYENRMALIMGSGAHSFIQTCLIDAGFLLKPKGTCVACGRPHGTRKNECDEWGAIDRTLGRRGHVDGLLEIPRWGRGLFEYKTIGDKASIGIQHNDIEWLKRRKFGYYCQVQEYLDMMGLEKGIILFNLLGFPWRLFEIEVPYDHEHVINMRRKFGNVREAEQLKVLPDPCCAIKSKEAKVCPARQICPVGKIH